MGEGTQAGGRLRRSRVLVTGGAGFIGSHLVRRLVAEGGEVVVLDDLSSGLRANLEGVPVALVEADVRDARAVALAARNCTHACHLAALVEVARSMSDPGTTHEINVLGTAHLLAAARSAGLLRTVLASSCAVYGDGGDEPLAEGRPLAPLSPYGASKAAAEMVLLGDARAFDQDALSLRFFNVYGPRQRAEGGYAAAVPAFFHAVASGGRPRVFGDGGQVRDFCFVEDVVEAIVLALASRERFRGESFNVASGSSVTVLQLLAAVQAALGASGVAPEILPARPGDIRASRADPRLALARLGFSARATLDEGLAACAAWMRTAAAR